MSGSTVESLTRDTFRITLETPRISFAMDPETGHSGEQEFHEQASRRFQKVLSQNEAVFRTAVESLPNPVIAFDENNHETRVSFLIPEPDFFTLEVCFEEKPDETAVSAMRQMLREYFKANVNMKVDS